MGEDQALARLREILSRPEYQVDQSRPWWEQLLGPVFDLATTASKLLHLGLSLAEVIRRVTSTPAACIGRADDLGSLRPGAAADLTLLRIAAGEWHFRDSTGVEELAGTRLEPITVIRAGRRYACTPS